MNAMQSSQRVTTANGGCPRSGSANNPRKARKNVREARRFRPDRGWILEDRILLAAKPEVTLGLPTAALVNEQFILP